MSSRFRSRSRSRSNLRVRTETELDVIGAKSMAIMQMNVKMLSQVILKVMIQIMQLYKLLPQIWNQMIHEILIHIGKIQNI